MAMLMKLVIILAIVSTVTSHSVSKNRKTSKDLSWLISLEESDAPNNNDVDNEIEEKMEETTVCETKECYQLARAFGTAMNKSADPCNNFYEYVCGGWKSKNPVPKSEPMWSEFMQFRAILESRIKEELEIESSANDILPVRQARKWYQSCMDTKNREIRGLNPIESILIQTGGWPMAMDLAEWNEDLTWQEIEANYARLTGDNIFYNILLDMSSMNPDEAEGIILLLPPEIPLGRELPLNYRDYSSDNIASYKLLMEGVTRLFIEHSKAAVSDEQLEKDINNLIVFERAIYKASKGDFSTTVFDEIISDYESEKLGGFLEWWDKKLQSNETDLQAKIDWHAILQRFFDIANIKVDDDMTVSVPGIRYFGVLTKILKETDKRTIVNYIHWKFVSETLKYTVDEMKDLFFELVKDEYGVTERPPRWRECVREMEMNNAASFMFVDKYYHRKTAEAATTMMKNIKKSLKEQIENSNWMSSEAKEASQKKLNAMKTLLGFPDWYLQPTAVITHYKGLTIGYDYLDNILSFRRYKRKSEIRKFAKLDPDSGWYIDPITINAVYSMEANTLNVPAVAFQSPLFGTKVPDYVNYGSAGVIIGHEMGHGFDPHGIRFGANVSDTLMDDSMIRIYFQRAECFVEQFDRYFNAKTTSSPNEPKSIRNRYRTSAGRRTYGENIADTNGLQAVLNAYKKMKKDNDLDGELKLPGFEEFTDEQMFFISFAGVWCEVGTPQYEKAQKESKDAHSPANLRVIGAVSNTKQFAEVFNCPKGSPMNPEEKCAIWSKPGAQPTMKNSRYRHHFHAVNW